MKTKLWLAGLVVGVSLLSAGRAVADDKKDPTGFGVLEATPANVVQAKAMAWLKAAANNNSAKLTEAQQLWSQTDRSVLENLADTFALGNKDAAELLRVVRDAKAPAPVEVPAILKDTKADPFFRANMALVVARYLSARRVHEEALSILGMTTPEQTVDPATYLFQRAVCEHALLKKDDAGRTLARLIQDAAATSPERYKTVAALMLLDMETWKKDLNNVARLMDNSERRLDLGRGGPQTQKIQREVVARLDEMIKELENKAKAMASDGGGGGGAGSPNSGACPDGGQSGSSAGGARPRGPMQDSQIATNGGSGKVDVARLNKLTDGWGKLSPSERAKAMQEVQDLITGLSPEHREAFERYFEAIRGVVPPQGTNKQ